MSKKKILKLNRSIISISKRNFKLCKAIKTLGLRRNSRWPEKMLTVKLKKILAAKEKVSGFHARLLRVLVPRSVRFAQSRSLFLCVNRVT